MLKYTYRTAFYILHTSFTFYDTCPDTISVFLVRFALFYLGAIFVCTATNIGKKLGIKNTLNKLHDP